MGKFSNTTTFTGLLERATSQLQLDTDWASILQICDCVRQQDVSPKFAVTAIKKKMFDRNPHVSKFAFTVLEACVKNCGSTFHDEIATKEFMEEMRNLIKNGPEPVKDIALGLIQTWSHAFRNQSKYKIIQDTYNLMKMEGFQFPTLKESDAMFSADCAPAWAEGDVCHMCRVKFGTFIRQHHCRNCGQVFCKKCSSKESIIPQFGIEKEVRVCDPCYFKLNPKGKSAQGEKGEKGEKSQDSDLPPEYLNSTLIKEAQVPPKLDPQLVKEQEEEELQLAMALSLSQEEAQKEKPVSRSWPSGYSGSSNGSSSPSNNRKTHNKIYSAPPTYEVEADSDVDPDLARYLNRSYWEGRKDQQSTGYTSPSAPEAQADERVPSSPAPYTNHSEVQAQEPVNEVEQSSETLISNFRSSIEMLAERMQTISGKGKHIAMDATVQSLFQTVSAMHPQLLRLIEQQEDETGKYEGIKEKLALAQDARVTLEAAREQHREKVRQQELEQDMLRRMQIEQKLELMRQQKAEYMAYQQRLQTERQLALEQQHQQLKYQKYMPQQYAGQYVAATDGGSPYSSMGYMPAAPMPPPGGVTQTDGSPYSSMNHVPTSGVPTAPGVPSEMLKGGQQPYGQPVSQYQQGYTPQAYPGVRDGSVRSNSPQFGGQTQAPPSYSQVEYAPYGSEVTDTQSIANGHPVPEYQRQLGPEVPYSGYQVTPGQPHPNQQLYASAPSSAPSLPQHQPQLYAQAGSHPPQQLQLPPYDGNQQFIPPQSQPPPQTSYNNQQQPAMPPQYQQPPMSAPQPESSAYPSLQMQGQNPQMQGQPPQMQGQPPQMQGQPPQMQGQPPQMQGHPPQMQGQPNAGGGYASPQQQHPQQMYEPQSQQYQTGGQYNHQPPQHQPSGPPPQRQLSDLQLISFD